jgi:hypothetical protein
MIEHCTGAALSGAGRRTISRMPSGSVLIWRFSGHGHDQQDGAWFGGSRWVGIEKRREVRLEEGSCVVAQEPLLNRTNRNRTR